MFCTPRFSYRCPETCVAEHEHGSGTVCRRVGSAGRVGTRVGYTGVLPSCSGRGLQTAERAPEPRHGVEWVVCRARAPNPCKTRLNIGSWGRRRGRLQDHPPGPVGTTLWSLPVLDPQNAALQPIGREFMTFSIKLVKTAKCRQNMSKRPLIAPISKTGLKYHLLIFSDFHFPVPSLPRN